MPGDVSLRGIEFKIVGNTDGASNSITSLIGKLNDLKAALASAQKAASGGNNIKEFAAGVKELNAAMNGGSTKYKKFAEAMMDVAAAAELLGDKVNGISELAHSMAVMANSKTSAAGFKNLADGMAAIGFATKFISKEALDNLDRMSISLARLSNVDLKGLKSAMDAVSSGKSTNPPSPVPDAIQDIVRGGDKIDLLKLKLATLQESLEKAFSKGDLSGAVRIRQQISSVTAEIQKLEAELPRPMTLMEKLNNVFDKLEEGFERFAQGLSSSVLPAVKGIGNALLSVFKFGGKAILSIGGKIGSVLTKPLRDAWSSAKGFAGSLGNAIGGFKRILGYRIIRTIIKEITQAFSEGIKHLYEWSKVMGGALSASGETFAQSMDRITTSLAYFKNSIGAAVAPIIGALAPAIDFLIDRIVTLLNLINQLLARLAGASSWNRAIKKAQEFGAAAGGAGEQAKKALAYLAPFDELNRLPADNDSGGGGGGGGEDFSGLFEEVMEFNEEIADFADKVRDAIERSDWQGLGILIGDKINELIDRIDFAGLGTKVGEKINALFTTEYWTLKTINFQNIGAKIAEFLTGDNGIGGALRAIDFTSIGGILGEKLTMLPDILIGFINKIDFSVLGENLGDLLRGFFDDVA